MARMVPTPILPTQSPAEDRLYEALHDQLPDDVVVYHGIEWLRLGRRPEEGEADFLVAHPDLGLLVIEVKGGHLRYDPATRRWFRPSNRDKLVKDPFTQARNCMHWVKDELELVNGHQRWMPNLGYAVAFPDGEYTEQAHPNAPLSITLDRRDMDDLADRIERIMEVWHRDPRTFGPEGMDALEGVLGYRVEVLVPLGIRIEEAERKTVTFTPEQAYVRDLLRRIPRAAVTGTAGSGKTLLALETARWLAAQGHRTLVTCFNKRLGAYLAQATADLEGVWAVHFHELAYQVALRAGTIEPFDPSHRAPDNDPYFTETLPDALTEAASALPDPFDAIVVDEGQDFRDRYWGALLALHASPDAGPLYAFADDNQNIYGGGSLPFTPSEVLPPIRSNMRNSREIQEFIAALYRKTDGAEPPLVDGESHGPVRIVPYHATDEVEPTVRELVRGLTERQGVALTDIVLLTPSRASKSAIRNNEMLGDLPLADERTEGKLEASSLHGFKGMERPVVILAELGERGESHLVEYLYVGGSRARYQLHLVARDDLAARLAELPGTRM